MSQNVVTKKDISAQRQDLSKARTPDSQKVCVKGYPKGGGKKGQAIEEALKAYFTERCGPIVDYYFQKSNAAADTLATPVVVTSQGSQGCEGETTSPHTEDKNTSSTATSGVVAGSGGPFCYIGFGDLQAQEKAIALDGTELPGVKNGDQAIVLLVRSKVSLNRPEKKKVMVVKEVKVARTDTSACKQFLVDGSGCSCGRNCHQQEERSEVVRELAESHGDQFLPPLWQREELIFDYDPEPYQWRRLMIDLLALGVKLDIAANKRNGKASGLLVEMMMSEEEEEQKRMRCCADETKPQSNANRAKSCSTCSSSIDQQQQTARTERHRGAKDRNGEAILATLHEVFDPKTMPQRSNRDPFHVAYSRILRSGAGGGEPDHSVRTTDDKNPIAEEKEEGDDEQAATTAAGISPLTMQSSTAEIVEVRERFEATLHKYVREVCAPALGVGPNDLVYQRSPTLRVGFPCVPGLTDKPMGRAHKDYEYFHQPSEVNFWLPMTEVFGTNTLHTESAVGRADFHPLCLGYGQCVRFWGNQCWHYCVPNNEITTRVSLDFRVIVKERFNADFKDLNGKPGRFKIGEFYRDSAEE